MQSYIGGALMKVIYNFFKDKLHVIKKEKTLRESSIVTHPPF